MVRLGSVDECNDCKAGRHHACDARGMREVIGTPPGVFGGSITHCQCQHQYHRDEASRRDHNRMVELFGPGFKDIELPFLKPVSRVRKPRRRKRGRK